MATAFATVLLAGCVGEPLEDPARVDFAPVALRLVRVDADGPSTHEVTASPGHGGVAFLNALPDRPVAVRIAGARAGGGACDRRLGFVALEGEAGGASALLAPGEMASLCLHAPGRHEVVVRAADGAPWVVGVLVPQARARVGPAGSLVRAGGPGEGPGPQPEDGP